MGSDRPNEDAVTRTRELGLFPEPTAASPYAADLEEPEVTQAAADDFWTHLHTEPASRQALLLEETCVRNAARRHRLAVENLDAVRAALGPRAPLSVWPGLTPMETRSSACARRRTPPAPCAAWPDSEGVPRARWRPGPIRGAGSPASWCTAAFNEPERKRAALRISGWTVKKGLKP
ncbi:hypothetical protein [Streptomyces sp. LN325]|uniref:hypothetical protein n=1 Tax=Streptomyces sp. LN325 TaxID=3112976 RepID=UPI00371D2FDE